MAKLVIFASLLLMFNSSWAQDTLSTKSGLRYLIVKQGEGNEAYANRIVRVNYVGTFVNGDTFDVSDNEGFEFVLGRGQVIKAWDEGIRMMSEGAIYEFFVPAKLGYGAKGMGDRIPPNCPLIFRVELIEVKNL
jgi:FKBP-type peptidyl-prolyl cis-trans isomerase